MASRTEPHTSRRDAAGEDASTATQAARKPVHKVRDGRIELAIWLNDGEDGPWYSVTHRRNYRQADAWKESSSYGQDDLLVLAKLLDLAHTWCLHHRPQGKKYGKSA